MKKIFTLVGILLLASCTKDEMFLEIEEKIKESKPENLDDFDANDSICRQVSNREPQLIKFSQQQDIIIFVSGKKLHLER